MSSLRVELKWEGIPELKRNLTKLGDKVHEVVEPVIDLESGRILAIALERTPVGDSGQLGRNVQIIPANVIIGLGGKVTDIEGGFVFLQKYAHVQHERTDFRHETGRSKYAESAIKDEGRAFLQAISRRVKVFLG